MESEEKKPDLWGEEASQTFIDYGRYFVLEREIQIETICRLVPPQEKPFLILELCCGEGLLAEAFLEHFSTATIIGFDGSPEMLEKAQERLRFLPKRKMEYVSPLRPSGYRPSIPITRPVKMAGSCRILFSRCSLDASRAHNFQREKGEQAWFQLIRR